MGPQLSKKYFLDHINEARALSGVLKVVYRDSDIKLIVATVAGSPVTVLRDYLGSVKFVVSFRKCSGYAVSSPMESEEISRKMLTYEQYEAFKKLLYSLRNSLAAGSAPAARVPAEECSICLDASVEVVLPCTHSFCAKCAKEWRETNPTCPCCRQDLIENAGEEWQLEDWNEDDLKVQFKAVTQAICDFLDALDLVPPNITETHKVLDIEGDEWELAVRAVEDMPEVELDESKEKPCKFMRP
jgi:hypothetical protein